MAEEKTMIKCAAGVLSACMAAVLGSIAASSALAQTAVTSVPSIAALEALGTTSPSYALVSVAGYYSGSTAGGGQFTWVTGACVPDGGTVFAANGVPTSGSGAGCWVRQYQGNYMMASWFGAKASNNTNDAATNTSALQAGLNAAQAASMGFMLDQCARYYINNTLSAPLDHNLYQGYPLKFLGCAAAFPFAGNAITGDPNDAFGSILSMVGDHPLFAYHDWSTHYGSGEVEISNIRWEGTTSSELVFLQAFTGHSSFHNNELVQYGTGSGIACNTCITSTIEWNFVVGASWNNSGGTRTGAGIEIQTGVNGGLAKVANNTSRGFLYGYYIGGGAGGLIKPLFDHNEASDDTYGWYILSGTQGAVFTDNYAEGINQTVFSDNGNYTRIEGTWAYSGFVSFIVTGTGVTGNIYTFNMPSTQDNR